jgi:DNA-binding transcriptional LysR family regulator
MRHAKERNAFFEPKAKPFNRVGRGIELTEAGYVFWRARNLSLRGWKRPNSPLNEFGSLKRGAIIVQASQTIVSYWLPHHLVTFRQAYPPIQIRLSNTARFAQRPKMERRKSDLSKAWGHGHFESRSAPSRMLLVLDTRGRPSYQGVAPGVRRTRHAVLVPRENLGP